MIIKPLSQAEFIFDMEVFCGRHGMAVSELGFRALKDRAFYSKIQKGLSPTLHRIERVYDFMIDYENAHVEPAARPAPLIEGAGDATIPISAPPPAEQVPSAVTDITLPDVTYGSRPNRKETPPEFVRRAYGHLLNGNFTRADLRRFDPSAEEALQRWEQRHGRLSLDQLNLPTKQQRNTRLLEEGIEKEPDSLRRAALKKIAYARKYRAGSRTGDA